MTPSRLTKQARREQLLDTALALVRTRGADGLTLPTLAEAAQVSRPIVYGHFGTRPQLLLELYRRLDERHRSAIALALETAAPDEIAPVLSAAYFACATDMPEFAAVSAALKGDPEAEAAQRALLDAYVDLMAAALAPHTALEPGALRLRCIGILGAAEAIAAELNRRAVTAPAAVGALTALITSGVDPFDAAADHVLRTSEELNRRLA
ncbi:TetR/AcrR family transcriptional regulator [Nocardia jiangsuensis]|uniref:TetR/AcrR family transcriptional regulator n=1 Tax=Nocardia jiangsuensis TaxID=1691563 RepID=A0ABV8DWQ8_9NOCA